MKCVNKYCGNSKMKANGKDRGFNSFVCPKCGATSLDMPEENK